MAIVQLQRGLDAAPPADGRRARLLYHLADAHFACYAVAECEVVVRQALEVAEAHDDDETLAQSLSLLGQVYSSDGRTDAELALIDEALAIARQSKNHWREARTLADLGWAAAGRGEFVAAI
ncbi:MAG: hypothetical protein KDE47_11060, partial [Caldilineaceae bacterium]|nr:hypothetical protein [Caldilineaceae bacterium]